MTHKVLDRTKEAASTSGTGTFTLSGAASGFKSFASQMTDADTTWYCAVNGAEWEIGLGTKTSATLARTTIINNSNGDTNPVNFSAPPTVYATIPGAKFNAAGGPAFSAWKNSGTAQATTAGVTTAMVYPDVQYDTHSSYNSTNGRFTPDVPGYYQINAGVSNNNLWSGNSNVNIRKNGSTVYRGFQLGTAGTLYTMTASATLYLNGTTDYADVGMFSANAGQMDLGTGSFFQGVLVQRAL